MLRPEGVAVRSGLDITERKWGGVVGGGGGWVRDGGIETKPMYVVRDLPASHFLCGALFCERVRALKKKQETAVTVKHELPFYFTFFLPM